MPFGTLMCAVQYLGNCFDSECARSFVRPFIAGVTITQNDAKEEEEEEEGKL